MILKDWRYDKDLDREEVRQEICALSERIDRIEEKLNEVTRTTR